MSVGSKLVPNLGAPLVDLSTKKLILPWNIFFENILKNPKFIGSKLVPNLNSSICDSNGLVIPPWNTFFAQMVISNNNNTVPNLGARIIDPKTGLIQRPWNLFFQQFIGN